LGQPQRSINMPPSTLGPPSTASGRIAEPGLFARPALAPQPSLNRIVVMLDGQNSFSIKPDLDGSVIFLRQPEFIDLLILPDEVGSFDPKGELRRRPPFDPDHGKVILVDPDLALEQILVDAFRGCSQQSIGMVQWPVRQPVRAGSWQV
jgi:hypothetical protein